jgi:hypothetical protein
LHSTSSSPPFPRRRNQAVREIHDIPGTLVGIVTRRDLTPALKR